MSPYNKGVLDAAEICSAQADYWRKKYDSSGGDTDYRAAYTECEALAQTIKNRLLKRVITKATAKEQPR